MATTAKVLADVLAIADKVLTKIAVKGRDHCATSGGNRAAGCGRAEMVRALVAAAVGPTHDPQRHVHIPNTKVAVS